VRFAPGRLRLANKTQCDRINAGGKTIGMVVVAFFAASAAAALVLRSPRRGGGRDRLPAPAADRVDFSAHRYSVATLRPSTKPFFPEALEELNGEDLGVITGLFAEEPDDRHRRLLRAAPQRGHAAALQAPRSTPAAAFVISRAGGSGEPIPAEDAWERVASRLGANPSLNLFCSAGGRF